MIDNDKNITPREQFTALLALSFGWVLFLFSALNYRNVGWFWFLIISRAALVVSGLVLSYLAVRRKIGSKNIVTGYLLVALCIQATHGILEGPTSKEFYGFTGILFLLAALSYRGDFRGWITRVFPFALAVIVVPLFFKSREVLFPLGTFVDNFSLTIAGVVLGHVIARLNADKYVALRSLVEEKQKALVLKEQTQRVIEKEVLRLREQIEVESRFYAMGQLAGQISHDIRSPLAALNAIVHAVQGVDEQTRVQLRSVANRIRDIASGLLAKNREKVGLDSGVLTGDFGAATIHSSERRSAEFLFPVIESAVSEKRLQNLNQNGPEIVFEVSPEVQGLCSEIQATELHRVLSNLLTNSIEASDRRGKIEVRLCRVGEQVQILVKDGGKGIPSELLSRVLERGGTFGKKNGNGFGLSHAKAAVESWGGLLRLESAVGRGTEVTIELPGCGPPEWFPQKISINSDATIVIADDDQSIHQMWTRRIEGNGRGIRLVHLRTPKELLEWFRENILTENSLYLCDNEFPGFTQTGIDVVEMAGIAAQTILVTGRWEEGAIRRRCEKIGLRLLPKPLVGVVSLNF